VIAKLTSEKKKKGAEHIKSCFFVSNTGPNLCLLQRFGLVNKLTNTQHEKSKAIFEGTAPRRVVKINMNKFRSCCSKGIGSTEETWLALS
jgi:hypothetical protein